MAVRMDADGEDYTRALALGTQSALTFTCWFKISVDRNTYSTIFSVDNGLSDNWLLQAGADGTTVATVFDASTQQGMGNLTVGTWYFVALATSGTTGTLYHRTAAATTLTAVTLSNVSGVNAATLRIGESPWGGEWLNGCVAGARLWLAQLTATEATQESQQYVPQRTANLAAWYPLVRPETTDYSGNARTLSGGTGTAREDGPPIPWRATTPRLIYLPSGAATHSADATTTATAAVTATGTTTKPAAVTLTGTATISGAGTATKPAVTTLNASLTITADAAVIAAPVNADATLTITTDLVGAATTTKPFIADAAITATTSAAAASTKPAAAPLTAAVTTTAIGAATKPTAATLTAVATTTATGTTVKPAAATLTSTATITADATIGAAPITAATQLAAATAITATATRTAPADTGLVSTASVTAAAAVVTLADAVLTVTASPAASSAKNITAGATLTPTAVLTTDAAAQPPTTRGYATALSRAAPSASAATRDTQAAADTTRPAPAATPLPRTAATAKGDT